jgi:hypothetical protein
VGRRTKAGLPGTVCGETEFWERRPREGAGMTELLVLDEYDRPIWSEVTGIGAETEPRATRSGGSGAAGCPNGGFGDAKEDDRSLGWYPGKPEEAPSRK